MEVSNTARGGTTDGTSVGFLRGRPNGHQGMSGGPTAVDDGRRTSPWPVFVALGFAVAELGVFFGVVPLAVGGIVVFGGSCSGQLAEVGHRSSLSRSLIPVGGVFVIIGVGLWFAGVTDFTTATVLTSPRVDGVALRGVAVLTGGLVLVAAGAGTHVWSTFADGRRGLSE